MDSESQRSTRNLAPDGPDLEQGAELDPADGAVARLVTQVVRTTVAETEMATRKDERVTRLTHADDTLRSTVLKLIIHLEAEKEVSSSTTWNQCEGLDVNSSRVESINQHRKRVRGVGKGALRVKPPPLGLRRKNFFEIY